ncbi:sorting nexin-22 isoform X2 [Conger conger]|uniref:sorting nexin-22 isoform X2 n=1 Tax=Conger conger TaxID=82655 RepID=UPI002A5A41CA|nr:sorting nexin-22 isoform X2 [Conger conger]
MLQVLTRLVPLKAQRTHQWNNLQRIKMPAQCLTMIEVSIPSLERAVDESGKLRKLFRVEILFNGRKHFVLRRHTEFQNLHRKLKKILQTPDFPSKRSPHLRQKPLEQRRQELEEYIQEILYLNEEVPQEILDFLQVKHFHSVNKICSFDSLDNSQARDFSQLLHQRVVGFSKDPYLLDSGSDLPDVIVDGVLQGLYPRDIRVSFTACTKPNSTEGGASAKGPRTTDKVCQPKLPVTDS